MINYNITVSNEQDIYPTDENNLEQIVQKMLNYALTQPNIKEISALKSYDLTDLTLNTDVLICDDEEIRVMNSQYRNIDKPTDVLSFALFADNPEMRIITNNEILLGEIIISAQTADKQAKENEKTFEEEVNFLLSHGILHLLGFDHHDEDSLEFMLKIQDEMILAI